MNAAEKTKKFTLVGAGPVGSLLAVFLAQRGFEIEIFERRPDMRIQTISAGRSINLAVSTRGLYALEQVGFKETVLSHAIPMKGRMMHSREGELSFQRYGRDDSECINSVSRGELNKGLMTFAEKTGHVQIHFNRRVTGVDLERKTLHWIDDSSPQVHEASYEVLVGTDGSASAVRHELTKQPGSETSESLLDSGYKEFHIPPAAGGGFLMEKNALHIWPRGSYMLIALPNADGSFTATLFLPLQGKVSFEALRSVDDVRDFFSRDFSDALRLMPQFLQHFFEHPTGHMTTVKCFPWSHKGNVLLMGDAAHAIVPFFGQGMNCGFEDCTLFAQCLDQTNLGEVGPGPNRGNWAEIFEQFQNLRKENCDAIADMAVENFVEMRDKVGNKKFLFQKEVEQALQKRFPEEYVSRYSLVTFSRLPYQVALKVGAVQVEILEELCKNIENINQIDWPKAGELINRQLAPLLKEKMQ